MIPVAAMAGLGLAIICAGFFLAFVLPSQEIAIWVVLAIGAALLGLAVFVEARRSLRLGASRRGRFGLGAAVEVWLAAGILVAVNAIGVMVHHRFDFTGLAQFTLTSQTQAVLSELDEPVEIVSFFSPGATAPVKDYAERLLDEYQRYTDRIAVRNVDPDLSPDQAREYGVDQFGALLGVLVFTGESGRKRVFGPEITAEAEHGFTGAILEVTGTRQKRVLFLTGHGERNLGLDFSSARDGLRDNLFAVDVLDLLEAPSIPAGAAALIIAGPRQPLSAGELDLLEGYLAEGGRLLVMIDPGSFGNLRELLSKWFFRLGDGYLVDPDSHVDPLPETILVSRDRNQLGLPSLYFPGATTVLPADNLPEGLELNPLAWSSEGSWLETSPQGATSPVYDADIDSRGPLAIGSWLALRTPGAAREARIAVIGDSDFAANGNFEAANNGDLLATVVNWLTEDASVIAVDRKPLSMRRLILSPEQARLLLALSIGLPPLLMFIAGGFVWWRRR